MKVTKAFNSIFISSTFRHYMLCAYNSESFTVYMPVIAGNVGVVKIEGWAFEVNSQVSLNLTIFAAPTLVVRLIRVKLVLVTLSDIV